LILIFELGLAEYFAAYSAPPCLKIDGCADSSFYAAPHSFRYLHFTPTLLRISRRFRICRFSLPDSDY